MTAPSVTTTPHDFSAAASLYPSMATATSPTRTAPSSAAASALYPSMQPVDAPTSTDTASEPSAADADAADTPVVTMPEAAYYRVEHVEAWEAEVTAGPLAASLPAARAFLKEHAPPELITMLNQSGYGSNPMVIKFVADLAAKFTAKGAR